MRRGMRIFLAGVRKASCGATPGPGRGPDGIPALVASAWQNELLSGYRQDPAGIVTAIPSRATEDLVAVRYLE